jgi:hypothetical protein
MSEPILMENIDFETVEPTVRLTIVTETTRQEIEIAGQILQTTDQLLQNLNERGLPVPAAPMLTKTAEGFMLHEAPSFG